MTAHRAERISEALREELSELIEYELSDPRIGSATVAGVEVSPDKRHALVRIAVLPDWDFEKTLAALEHAKSYLRHELATRLEIHRIPELHFEPDVSTELGGRMENLLKRIKKGRPRE